VLDMAARDKLSVKATYQRVLPSMAGNMIRGTASQVVDFMEDWYRSKACDGFILSMPVQPRSLRAFVELVVPELERRGLRTPEYPGKTLRENMGLSQPPDPFLQRPLARQAD
jgi:alkanesulfonate monooxygenase SsuD/methylene tetrahydromethanopterin reductase-like flavin-dependent oxidoreductase (luciferase family)